MLANVEIIKNPKESMDRAYIFPRRKEELLIAFSTINSLDGMCVQVY